MNTRQLILGVLHRGDFHPYEIKRRLEAAMVECYIDVDVGTLYYAVRQLEKDGLIEPVTQERVPRGGIRTIYRITASGRDEFRKGLHRQFDLEGPVLQKLYGALLFLHLADPEIVKVALRRAIERLDGLIAKLDPIREGMSDKIGTGGKFLLDHIERQRLLDRDWLKALLAEIERNGIDDASDPATLDRRSEVE